jgi:hypothetical protein
MLTLSYHVDRKAIYDRSGAENVKTKESGRLAWLLWRSAYFTQTLSLRNKCVQLIRSIMGFLSLLLIRDALS